MPIKKSDGKYYTWLEFFRQWKKGMKEMTPYQQCKSNNFGYLLILIGVAVGMLISIQQKIWWLLMVLIGTFIVQGNAYYINHLRMKQLKQFEREVKNGFDRF